MKKILMALPYVPYPQNSGGAIRSYNLLQHLHKTYDITLVCLVKDNTEQKNAMILAKQLHITIYTCARPVKPFQFAVIWRYITSWYPFVVARNYSEEGYKTIQQLLNTQSFACIHAETLYMMQNIPPTSTPIVLLEHTFEYGVYAHISRTSSLWRRCVMLLETNRLKWWSNRVWQRAQKILAVSLEDKQSIEKLAHYSINVEISPSGASDEMFVLPQWQREKNARCRLLFTGNFQWAQNREAAAYLIDQIWPRLDHERFALSIAGDHIPAAWKCFSPREKDMVLLYRSHDIMVAPIYGPGGTRLKLLSAMASKLPIVTTTIGAAGLHLTDGISICIAHNLDEFVQKILYLAASPTDALHIAQNAYDIATRDFTWKSITKKLSHIYETMS